MTLRLDVRVPTSAASIIDFHGDVTATSEDVLMDAYNRASGPQTRAIILNFADLDYMNSGGIGLLVTLLVRVRRRRQQLRAIGLTEHYRQILELTRLDEAIAVHESEADALAATS
jgi:anti-sigma B factor antagonist